MGNILFIELIIYLILILTNLVIVWQWAKNGLWEVGIQIPPNFKVIGSVLIGMGTFFLAGFIERKTQTFFLTKEENILTALLIFLGTPSLFFLLVRYVILPRGLPEYNRAKHRTLYWARKEYIPGIKKEQGNNLAKFSRAIDTLALFKKSIQLQERNLIFPRIIKKHKTKEEELSVSCPCCCFVMKIIPAQLDGLMKICPSCKGCLSFRAFKDNTEVIGFNSKKRKISYLIKKNITITYMEMAFLLRIMNKFDEAINSLNEAEKIINQLLDRIKDKDNKEYISIKEDILFLKLEIACTMGDKNLAKRFYYEIANINGEPPEEDFIKDLIPGLN